MAWDTRTNFLEGSVSAGAVGLKQFLPAVGSPVRVRIATTFPPTLLPQCVCWTVSGPSLRGRGTGVLRHGRWPRGGGRPALQDRFQPPLPSFCHTCALSGCFLCRVMTGRDRGAWPGSAWWGVYPSTAGPSEDTRLAGQHNWCRHRRHPAFAQRCVPTG